MRKLRPIPLPIRRLNLLRMAPIPMNPHHPHHEQMIARAHPRHRLLQRHRIPHDAIGTAPHHLHERHLHVAREFAFQHLLERDAVAGLVGLRDGADLAVGAGGEDRADGELVCAGAALGGAVDFGDVGVDVLGQDGRGVFLAGGGEDHHEQALCFHAEVAADVGF